MTLPALLIRHAAALAVALTTGFATMPAFAEFGTPVALGSGFWGSSAHRVAMNSDGRALVVWKGASGPIELRERTAAGVWGPVQAGISNWAPGFPGVPEVAIDASGNALILWTNQNKRHVHIYGRTRSADGVLGPIKLFSGDSGDTEKPQVVMNASGKAFIAWRSFDGTLYGRPSSAGGGFGPIVTVAEAPVGSYSLGIDGDGNALVVWAQHIQDGLVLARKHTASGELGPAKTLSREGGNDPRVAMNANGEAVVVWSRNFRIEARTRAADGLWGRVQRLSTAGESADQAHVAMNANGEAVVVWRRLDKSRWLQARSYSAAGELGPVQTLSPPGERVVSLRVAIDAGGNAVIAWGGVHDGPVNALRARTRLATGEVTPVQTLSLSEQGNTFIPRVVKSSDGTALVTWDQPDESGRPRVTAAIDDGSAASAATE